MKTVAIAIAIIIVAFTMWKGSTMHPQSHNILINKLQAVDDELEYLLATANPEDREKLLEVQDLINRAQIACASQ